MRWEFFFFTFYRLRELKLSKGKTVAQGHTARSWGSQDLNPGPVDQSHVSEREPPAYAKHVFLLVIREGSGHQRPSGILIGGRASPLPQVRGEGNRDAFEEDQVVWCAWSRWGRGPGMLGGNSESQLVFGPLAKL